MAEKKTDTPQPPASDKPQRPAGGDMASWKPGSEPQRASEVGSEGDFGVPVGAGPSRDRDYVNENTKRSDPGATQPFDWEHDGKRDHGAGARDSGPGSGSAGDLDPDLIGFGTGGGVAASPADEAPGPDDSDGTSNEFASPLPPGAPGVVVEPASGKGQSGPRRPIRGSVVQGTTDIQTGPEGQGSDAATNPAARGDDSFAGEISSGEAQGDDLPISPSSDTEGLIEGDNQIEGDQKDVRGDS